MTLFILYTVIRVKLVVLCSYFVVLLHWNIGVFIKCSLIEVMYTFIITNEVLSILFSSTVDTCSYLAGTIASVFLYTSR